MTCADCGTADGVRVRSVKTGWRTRTARIDAPGVARVELAALVGRRAGVVIDPESIPASWEYQFMSYADLPVCDACHGRRATREGGKK